MRTALLVATVFGALLTAKASSEEYRSAGRNFVDDCRAYTALMTPPEPTVPVNFDTVYSAGFCYGVVSAVAATISRDIVCPPSGTSTRELIASVLKFFEKYREPMALDQSSPAGVVVQALVVEYPCPVERQADD